MQDATDEMNDQTSDGAFAGGRILVVALKGWNDAGEAATNAVKMLASALGITERSALIDDESFFDYSINRPQSVRSATGARHILWPQVELLTPASARVEDEHDHERTGEHASDAPLVDPSSKGFDLERDSDPVEQAGALPLFSIEEPEPTPLFSIADLGDRVERDRADEDGVENEKKDENENRDSGEVALDHADPNLAGDAEMRITAANRDNLLVMLGHEPTLHWRAFTARVLELCEQHEVTRLVLVGALLADVPHSRPIGVFVSSEHRPFRDELGIGRSEYQGPTGVLAALSHVGDQHGIPSVSLWASVPHYASQPPSPKAELAVIDKLEELLDVSLPRTDLIDRAEHWEEEVDAATSEDGEIADYVDYLERAHDMVEAPEASGEAIAKEFERFLRQGEGRGEAPRSPQAAGPWTGPIHKPGVPRTGDAGELGETDEPDAADEPGEAGEPGEATGLPGEAGESPDDRAGSQPGDDSTAPEESPVSPEDRDDE